VGALIFGAVYAGVAAWGFADGDDVVNQVATDTDDNWLHVGLATAGVVTGLLTGALGMSARREHRRLEREVTEAGVAGRPTAAPAGRPSRRRFLRRTPKEQAAEREPPQTTETGRRE
jgi:hypothetical protein